MSHLIFVFLYIDQYTLIRSFIKVVCFFIGYFTFFFVKWENDKQKALVVRFCGFEKLKSENETDFYFVHLEN